jgi:hypothetical protein
VLLAAWRPGRRWPVPAALVGLACGLAVLTKGSLVVMVAPAAAVLLVLLGRREQAERGTTDALRRVGAAAAVVVVVAGLASGPFLLRNVAVFGGVTGPDSKANISTDLGPRVAVANIVRSTSANFRIGDGTGVESALSRAAFDVLRPIFDATRVDPGGFEHTIGTDLRAFEPGNYAPYQRTEEYGANPWHVLLIVGGGSVLAVVAIRRRRELRPAVGFAIGLAVGFAAFTALNKWSPFAVRYQVPLLVGWAAPLALLLERSRVRWLVGAGLAVAALPALFENSARPVVHPTWPFATYLDGYYAGGAIYSGPPVEEFDRVAAALAASPCRHLAITNWVRIEYPLWVALEHHGWDGRIEHIDVGNDSAELIPDDFERCAVVYQTGIDTTQGPVHLVLDLHPDEGQ